LEVVGKKKAVAKEKMGAGYTVGIEMTSKMQRNSAHTRLWKVVLMLSLTTIARVTGQNGSGQNGTDKMIWTKWYGQNGTDKMVQFYILW